jgi:hypothetical protein
MHFVTNDTYDVRPRLKRRLLNYLRAPYKRGNLRVDGWQYGLVRGIPVEIGHWNFHGCKQFSNKLPDFLSFVGEKAPRLIKVARRRCQQQIPHNSSAASAVVVPTRKHVATSKEGKIIGNAHKCDCSTASLLFAK